MLTKWTSHLNDEDKPRFESAVRGSKKVLERLKDITDEMEADLNKAEVNPKNYEIPNWDYRQAHNNGYRQCLNMYKRLLDIKEDQT